MWEILQKVTAKLVLMDDPTSDAGRPNIHPAPRIDDRPCAVLGMDILKDKLDTKDEIEKLSRQLDSAKKVCSWNHVGDA